MQRTENRSKLPLSSDDVKTTVSSQASDDDEASRRPDTVERLQREAGDGASAVPNSSESTTNVFHKRTKARNGSLFDEDDDDEDGGGNGDGDGDGDDADASADTGVSTTSDRSQTDATK